MDRRGGMAPMMPFFPGSGLGDQPSSMPAPDMPPFPHMRERFPNAVWAPDGSQGQWGAFHPPGLAPPPMGPPAHPNHQFNQFEPRQPVFNFPASANSQTPTPTQFNNNFTGQYNGNQESVTGYVPQGHFSPQTTTTSVPYSSGAPSVFLGHTQGNGMINATNAQPHPYPPNNEYAQAPHHTQQAIFKPAMPSPSVSGAEQSPIQSSFSAMPSPHTSNNHNEQTIIPTSVPCQVPTYPTTDCTAAIPQSSPHTNATPCTSMGNNAPNFNSSVQSRLKTMIMSRQGGAPGTHGSAFSPGLSDSPPPGELRFSGSVAAVTSVEASPDATQVQESIKMAQNFLAYRTTGSSPGSVVQHSSDEKGGNNGDFAVKPLCAAANEKLKSDCDTLVTNLNRADYITNLHPSDGSNITLNKDCGNYNTINQTKVDKCELMYKKADNDFKQPEQALEELFNGTESSGMETFLRENSQTNSVEEQIFSRDTNLICSDTNEVKTNDMNPNLPNNCNRTFLKPSPNNKKHGCNKTESEYINRCETANSIIEQNVPQPYDASYPIESCQKQPMNNEPPQNIVRSDKGKNSSLSVYDFPDSPDQQPVTQKGCAGFRLGRVRGAGLPITTMSTHCRPVCANAPLCTGNNMPVSTHVGENGRGAEGNEQEKVRNIIENAIPPSLSHPQPFDSHVSTASALSSTINLQYTSFLPTTTVNSSCSTIPSLVGKDGHSSVHKQQNCISPPFHKQNMISHSIKAPLPNQRPVENFRPENVTSDVANNPTSKSSNTFTQMSTQTSESMSNISKINPNLTMSQQSSPYNAFYDQRNAMFNNQGHIFPQSAHNSPFFICNSMPGQSNFNTPTSFNSKPGMSCPPVGPYGNTNQYAPQSSSFYQQVDNSKLVNNAKMNEIIMQENIQPSSQSSLESLQKISISDESKTNVSISSPQQSPKNTPHISPAHSTPANSSSLITSQSLTQSVNPCVNQAIQRISPQRSSPQDINPVLPQNPHTVSHGQVMLPFSIMQGIPTGSTNMIQSPNPIQSVPNVSPINMLHHSPQNMPHQSPQNLPSHVSPQGAPPHVSPQSIPLSSPQNIPTHPSPQSVPHPSPQAMSHVTQNIIHSALNLPPQQPQPSPQSIPNSIQSNLPQTSPQNIPQSSPQGVGLAQVHNRIAGQNVPHHIMPIHLHQNINHQQHNLAMKNSQMPHPNVIGHPAQQPQNMNHLPSGSSFPRPAPINSSYSMVPSQSPNINNAAPHAMHPSFASNYSPYGMPYQSMNPGYQHRMYPPMHMGPVPNQVYPNCQHPIKGMSNIAMPQNMIQPCAPEPPTPPTKSRSKKGAPKKPRKPKETKSQKQKQQKEEQEAIRLQEQQQQQQFHSFSGKESVGQQNPPIFPNNQMVCQPWGQPPSDRNMQPCMTKLAAPPTKTENFQLQPIPFPTPQGWNPAMGAIPNPYTNDMCRDTKISGVVVPDKPLLHDSNTLGNASLPNREDYTPLNMLNQQQSEIFKNIYDDSKAVVPAVPTKFDVPKNQMFNSQENKQILNTPRFPIKAEDIQNVNPINAALSEKNVEPNNGMKLISTPINAIPQISPYSEQTTIEKQIKQENENALPISDVGNPTPISNQTCVGNPVPINNQQSVSNPVAINNQGAGNPAQINNQQSIGNPVPINNQQGNVELNNSMQDHQRQTSYMKFANNVKEESPQTDPSHPILDAPTVYPNDPILPTATVETAIQTPLMPNQNIGGSDTMEKVNPTETTSVVTEDAMDIEQIKNRMKNNELLIPKCSCVIPSGTPDSGPVYTHLGAASSLQTLRQKLSKQTGYDEAQIRIERVAFTGKEGKTESGCPLPKWIIRRSGPEEKVLVVVKQRLEHTCDFSWIVVVLVSWEGFPSSIADDLYSVLVEKLNKFGNPTERRCGTNEDRTCACQGDDPDSCGASFSFGCSWSMYYNMCKFARSKNTRKFKLNDEKEEREVEEKLQSIATSLGPVYERMAPIAYRHQVSLEEESLECRLGKEPGRPWTGVTACLDFCSHSHKDSHNIHNGCTVIATLTKGHGSLDPSVNLREQTPADEQLHILPLYLFDTNDENGNVETFEQKVKSGAVQVLSKYPFPMRLRSEPLLSCRARNLLARGLPLPNSIRGKAKAKAKVVSLANIRRKSSGDNIMPAKKKPKSDVKAVSDKLGLDVDYMLASADLEDNYDDFSKYSIDSDDYSWLLDLGNDDESTKSTSSSQTDNKDDKEPNGTYTDAKGMPSYSGNQLPSGTTGTMPPPQSPAPRRTNSPGLIPTQHSTASPAVSPSMGLTMQSPVESPPPVLTPVPNLSPFSPQMPHLSPHGSNSSPDSPRKTTQSCEMIPTPSSLPEQSLAVTHASLFTASHNSPEMPRLSPHVTLGAFSPIGMSRPVDKLCPNVKQLQAKQSSNRCQVQPELENKTSDQLSEECNVGDIKSREQFSMSEENFLESNDTTNHIFTRHSDNYQSFQDSNVGGVAIALTHGSVLFEYARQELHSSTALKNPNRKDPKRISLVFYHHKNLIYRNHGMKEFEEKMEKKRNAAEKEEKEGKPPAVKKRKSNKRNKDEKDQMEPLNGIKRMKFDIDEGHLGMPDHKKGHSVSNKCATVFPPSHMHLPHNPDLISPPISYANYPHTLPSFVDGGRPYSPSGLTNSNNPVFSLASKSPHLITSQSPSLDTYSQKPVPTTDHNYGTPSAHNHTNILPPFNTNLQEFNPYNTRGQSPYPGHFQPYMEMSGNNFSSYQPSGYFPKGHVPPMNYNATTYVPQPFYGLTPPYSPGPQPHGQPAGGPAQSQMPFAPGGPTQPITNPFDDSMRSGGPVTNPTATWSQMRHVPSFHIHGPYSPWPGS